MNVLHLAPLWYPISRDAPGGIETFVAGLLISLSRVGCRNTLIASGDSKVEAELLPASAQNLCALIESGTAWEYEYYEQSQLLLALERAHEFDVIHSHLGYPGYVLSGVPGLGGRVLHTQHNPVTADHAWLLRRHRGLQITAVSPFLGRSLREQGVTNCRIVPNGIDFASFKFQPKAEKRAVFLGRMEWEKGPDLAIKVARELGWLLDLAGPIIDEAFYGTAIEPFLDDSVHYRGIADHDQKVDLLGRAGCAVLASRWDEPFGLVAIEAMACGTPVVTLSRGAFPDLIEQGITGFVVDAEDELAAAVARAGELDRAAVRSCAEARFDLAAVAQMYVDVYSELLEASLGPRPTRF